MRTHPLSPLLLSSLLLLGCQGTGSLSGTDVTLQDSASGDTQVSQDTTSPQDTAASQDTGTTTAQDTTTSQDTGAPPQDTMPPPQDTTPPGTPLADRLGVSDVTIPDGAKRGVSNWRIWGRGSLGVAPVFTEPLANCGTLVCFTTSGAQQTARVAKLSATDTLETIFDLGQNLECRGLAVEPDGHFAALLWDDSADRIYVKRYDIAGSEVSSTELTNSDNKPDDFGIGDSRMAYGDGRYGAYYHVHSNSGHEGDTLKWIDAASGAETTGWSWGCSHSMSNLLTYHPDLTKFMPACVTDCFPGTSGDFSTQSIGGIYLNHRRGHVLDINAGCNGSVAGELGGASVTPNGWTLVFNAHQAAASPGQNSYDGSSMNQDIGLARVAGDYSNQRSVVWLTNTADIDENDSAIAPWQPSDSTSEEYVVGWNAGGSYQLARIGADGAFIEGPIDVSSTAQWGKRDDPFRAHANHDVVWSWFDGPGSTTLHIARLSSGQTASCASF